MKRTILTLICSLCIPALYAQTKTTLEKLEGKWVMQFPSKNPAVVEYLYTKETITETAHLLGHHLEKTRPYYVSDEMVEEFDSTKIGKYPNGKYIMTYFKKGNQKPELEVRHEEILELSDTLLVIKNLYNNVILTYKKDKSYIISELINHYLTDKTFYEYDNTYQCDLDEKTRWVTLYNKTINIPTSITMINIQVSKLPLKKI